MSPILTASLPMYNFQEIRAAAMSFWRGIAKYLRLEGMADVPDCLIFDRPLSEFWGDKSLLFSQCCGYDVVRSYEDTLLPIAVPHFDVAGCAGGEYSSRLVVAENCPHDDVLDMQGSIAVINGPESHSGMSALRHLVAPENVDGRFFKLIKVSGAHIDSIGMVRRGEADVAAIDCVTHELLTRYRPETLAGTRVLGRTYRAPAPPYVTRADYKGDVAEKLQTALFRAFADPDLATARHALFLKDLKPVDIERYRKVAEFEEYAESHGYPVLQ